MTDKTPDDTPVEAVPKSEPTKPPTSKPASKPRQVQQTPLERAVHAFVDGFEQQDVTDRLLVEFERIGIESLEDIGPHRLGDVRRALQVTLRATAHAFYAAAAEFRSK